MQFLTGHVAWNNFGLPLSYPTKNKRKFTIVLDSDSNNINGKTVSYSEGPGLFHNLPIYQKQRESEKMGKSYRVSLLASLIS